jgi:zinc transport system substrate-binding protein
LDLDKAGAPAAAFPAAPRDGKLKGEMLAPDLVDADRPFCRRAALRSKFNYTLRAVLASLLLAACGAGRSSAPATPAAKAPARPLEVVVSAYPLAVLVTYLGGKWVKVVDLAAPGGPPQDLSLRSDQVALVRTAPLVVDVGDGYQPSVEAAARSAHRHLSLLPAVSSTTQPYEFWLDPALMSKAAALVAAALTTADVGAKRQFDDASQDFQSVVGSIESDLESTFSDCTRQVFVTADGAFERFATSFGLTDVDVASMSPQRAAALVKQDSLPDVFSEAGTPTGALDKVARLAGVGVKSLDPMEVVPAPNSTAPRTYFGIMEEDLTALEVPLACDTTDTY